jgi:alpha-L-fucosidase
MDACREFGLRMGFYSSLMDWHHPDGWRCAFDTQARARFTSFIRESNRELMTQYGKIDILWYDVARPMESWEGWDSLELNQMVRELQPDILINNRSRLDEDFGTPEGRVAAMDRDWEACMTFNDISWGYVDSAQAAPYSYNAQLNDDGHFVTVYDCGELNAASIRLDPSDRLRIPQIQAHRSPNYRAHRLQQEIAYGKARPAIGHSTGC